MSCGRSSFARAPHIPSFFLREMPIPEQQTVSVVSFGAFLSFSVLSADGYAWCSLSSRFPAIADSHFPSPPSPRPRISFRSTPLSQVLITADLLQGELQAEQKERSSAGCRRRMRARAANGVTVAEGCGTGPDSGNEGEAAPARVSTPSVIEADVETRWGPDREATATGGTGSEDAHFGVVSPSRYETCNVYLSTMKSSAQHLLGGMWLGTKRRCPLPACTRDECSRLLGARDVLSSAPCLVSGLSLHNHTDFACPRKNAVIGDLLDVTRIEKGAMSLYLEPFDVGSLARDVAKTFSGEAKSKACLCRNILLL